MDSADPIIFAATRSHNPVTNATRAVADKVQRLEANVLNMPLTSLVSAVVFGAGVVALGVLIGQALEPRVKPLREPTA